MATPPLTTATANRQTDSLVHSPTGIELSTYQVAGTTGASPGRLLFVVPTRNRSTLAIHTISELLRQRNGGVHILVSDNSTIRSECQALQDFCAAVDDRLCLTYVRPREPLGMSDHWNWALGEAVKRFDLSHLAVITDRFVLRPHAVETMCNAIRRRPEDTIVYRYDSVFDHLLPCQVEFAVTTGAAYQCVAQAILDECSGLRGYQFVPVLLNCIVTRGILERVRSVYGDYCKSLSPDFAFGFRALSLLDHITFLDQSLTVNWAKHRSNGFSMTRGVMTSDSHDFIQQLPDGLHFTCAPIPEISATYNAIVHEYVTVRTLDRGSSMKPIDPARYLEGLYIEALMIEDVDERKRILTILDEYGPMPSHVEDYRPSWEFRTNRRSARTPQELMRALLINEFTRSIWWALFRWAGITLPYRLRFNFRSPASALYYALHAAREKPRDGASVPVGSSLLWP